MADLIAYQNGNWTAATTWKGVATGTNAKQGAITASTTTTTSDVASSNFTIGNGTVVEGVMVHCRRENTTGTVTVGIYDGTTLQRDVTVNASDLSTGQAWVFFKFATTFTATNSSTYNVRVRASSAGNATFWRDTTAGNWSRYIRNNTTATAAAADVTFICNELTGAGTNNAVTVTMNQTLTTQYGECNVGLGGVLSFGTSASTNYILRIAGNMNVWGGGTLNIGTSGTAIPSTSTAYLQIVSSTAGQYALSSKDGSTVNMYGPSKATKSTLLTADAASGQAVLTVASTSGWLAGDSVAIASTTRTSSQTELRTISTVDSATQVTLTATLTNTHHGTAPYQGEVINLTRAIGVVAITNVYTLGIFGTATFTASYAQFNTGAAASHPFDVATTTGSCSITNCAITASSSGSSPMRTTGISGSPTIEDCVMYYPGSSNMTIATTTGTPSFQRNVLMCTNNGPLVIFNDLGGTIRDNRFIGFGTRFDEAGATIGTIKDNVQHSGTTGIQVWTDAVGTFDGFTIWRNASSGVSVGGGGCTLSSFNVYHNAATNVDFTTSLTSPVILQSCTFNGGSGASLAATSTAANFTYGIGIVFDSCTFGDVTTHTAFITARASVGLQDVIFRKCAITDTVAITNQSNLLATQEFTSAIKFDKFNNTSGSHRTYKRYGRTEADQATYKTAAPSEALLPNNASNKLTSGSKKFAVASGTTATVTVYVNKSATYNGNQPRLIVKANSIAGISTDTVLATASGGTGSWLTLSGTTATVSDNCVLEVYVDCDGTAGTVYVDDWSVS